MRVVRDAEAIKRCKLAEERPLCGALRSRLLPGSGRLGETDPTSEIIEVPERASTQYLFVLTKGCGAAL